VQEGSEAALAGLCVNDIIMKVNKIETYKGTTDVLILEQIRMGKVKLQVLRPHAGCVVLLAQQHLQMGIDVLGHVQVLKDKPNKWTLKITEGCTLKIKKVKITIPSYFTNINTPRYGFSVSSYEDPVCQPECFYVSDVQKGSRAARAGLRVNDIIKCVKTYTFQRCTTYNTFNCQQMGNNTRFTLKLIVFRPEINGVIPPLTRVPSLPYAANPELLEVATKQRLQNPLCC